MQTKSLEARIAAIEDRRTANAVYTQIEIDSGDMARYWPHAKPAAAEIQFQPGIPTLVLLRHGNPVAVLPAVLNEADWVSHFGG